MHLVAFSNFNNLDLFGNRYSKPISKKNFVKKAKRGPKSGRDKYGKALDPSAKSKNTKIKKFKK